MKFLIETGSESHTTSSASLQAKYHGGEYDGEFLYEIKSRQVSAEWHNVQGGRWVTTVYELPDRTEIEVIGKGRTGDRGSKRYETHTIYRLEPDVDVLDTTIDTGLRCCDMKGRLVMVRDVLENNVSSLKKTQNEGF